MYRKLIQDILKTGKITFSLL